VRRYQVLRSVDDPNYVLVDLEFDGGSEAEAMRAALVETWRGVEAEGLILSLRAQIVDSMETREY
jgi:hypothetical protein